MELIKKEALSSRLIGQKHSWLGLAAGKMATLLTWPVRPGNVVFRGWGCLPDWLGWSYVG